MLPTEQETSQTGPEGGAGVAFLRLTTPPTQHRVATACAKRDASSCGNVPYAAGLYIGNHLQRPESQHPSFSATQEGSYAAQGYDGLHEERPRPPPASPIEFDLSHDIRRPGGHRGRSYADWNPDVSSCGKVTYAAALRHITLPNPQRCPKR